MALKGTRGDTSIPWKKKGVKDMDVNEPEAGESAASLRLGLRTALFSRVDCKSRLAAERGEGGSERQSNFFELLQG